MEIEMVFNFSLSHVTDSFQSFYFSVEFPLLKSRHPVFLHVFRFPLLFESSQYFLSGFFFDFMSSSRCFLIALTFFIITKLRDHQSLINKFIPRLLDSKKRRKVQRFKMVWDSFKILILWESLNFKFIKIYILWIFLFYVPHFKKFMSLILSNRRFCLLHFFSSATSRHPLRA